jgi:hypothetical protein
MEMLIDSADFSNSSTTSSSTIGHSSTNPGILESIIATIPLSLSGDKAGGGGGG